MSYEHLYLIEKRCRILKVSRSSYYRQFSHVLSNGAIENSLFTDLIKEVFDLSNHPYSISRNHLNRNFRPKSLNEVCVSDITYIKTTSGWSLSKELYTDQTIIPAWKMVISKRQITKSLLFHSDRVIQYTSIGFRK
ncbi:hypothetical protein [Thalassobellus citreus]|uniref:hypothetical protein n=1 Tax=Thalassobellus citreus TaxID=3367752 RepID=UPI0037B15607